MRTYLYIFSALILLSCNKNIKNDYSVDWKATQLYYLEHLEKSISNLEQLKLNDPDNQVNIQLFNDARSNFKIAEPYAAYLNPEVGHRANGPALPVFRDDNGRVLPPIGLQKIEESIYDGNVSSAEFTQEVENTIGLLNVLRENIKKRELTPTRFFVATQQQLMRIISFSLTNFDTPLSQQGLDDTALTLNSLKKVYSYTIRNDKKIKGSELDRKFIQEIDEAIEIVENYGGTNYDFDRFTFIRDHINPICRSWKALRDQSGYWKDSKDFPFNFEAETFFESDSFNLAYFTPTVNRNPSKEQIALGEKLFFDPNLSKDGKISCASCHVPDKDYQDGFKTALDNTGKSLPRNTPTLINVAYQQIFFWDGRSEDLLSQINQVFTNDREFNTDVHQFSDAILKDSSYTKIFKDVFGRVPNSNKNLIKAISSYIATLKNFDSKFDRNIRGNEESMTASEINGFNLYMGKALCASCHFMPLTNGTVPPFFMETEKEVIGVSETSKNDAWDNDPGFYIMYEEPIHWGMFKTPSIREIANTSPYMHNGIYSSLEEVIDFYNKGGGAGLGFDIPHQTLPFDQLNLTEKEQIDLVAYMKTLSR